VIASSLSQNTVIAPGSLSETGISVSKPTLASVAFMISLESITSR